MEGGVFCGAWDEDHDMKPDTRLRLLAWTHDNGCHCKRRDGAKGDISFSSN